MTYIDRLKLFLRNPFKGDLTIWIIFMLLCFISLVEVYSATSTLAYKNLHFWSPIVRHAKFLFGGFIAVLVLQLIPHRLFSYAIILLPISMLMLGLTPIIGVKINEAYRFLSFMGIQFQPSEFGKMACIVFVAFMLSKQERFSPDRRFWIILISVSITCLLILSENFSTAVLLFVVCFLMMFVGQMPMKKMLLLLLVLTFSAGFVFFTLRSISDEFIEAHCPAQLQTRVLTIKGRVDDFGKDKGENKYTITDDNFQVSHAKIAIARGSILGKLPGRSVQRDFLPQAYSDFIYAIIIEEMGLIVGGVGVMMLYVILMIRVANIARRCKKLFPKYLALGCGLLIVVQAFINMAVAVNLIPVTGQPLPLISRGGTSTMLTCFYFGIILSVSRFGAGMGEEEDEEEEEIMDNDENDEPVESDENDENGILLKSNDEKDELVVTEDFIVIDEKDENDEEI